MPRPTKRSKSVILVFCETINIRCKTFSGSNIS